MTTIQQLEKRLQDDFVYFAEVLWHGMGLPKLTRAQRAMCRYLQHGPKRLQLSCFRGVGKSYITAGFAIWTLFRDRDKKILVVSASKSRADDFSLFCQRLILEQDWLADLRPRDSDTRWSRISFDVGGCTPAQSPSVKSVGITGQLTGSRADLIIFDDVEVPSNSATDLQREKLLNLIQEGESVLTPKNDSRIMFLGTPQTTFTVYRSLAERGYRQFVWPARYPKAMTGYEDVLAGELVADIEKHGLDKLAWQPTDSRFSDFELTERESSMARSNFQLQFMLDTSLSDALKFPLKLSDFVVTTLDRRQGPGNVVWSGDPRNVLDLPAVALPGDRWHSPARVDDEYFDWKDTIVAVDPSGRGADETVAIILSQLNGIIYVRRMLAFQDGYADNTLRTILREAKVFGAHRCVIESNFGDGAVMELMKRHAIEMKVGIDFEEVRATTRKEDRIIDTLEPVLNQHRLVIDPEVIKWDYQSNPDLPQEERLPKMLMYQLTRMCREKGAVRHDDRVDCLALGVRFFQDILAVSAQQANIQKKRQEWNAMLDTFLGEPQLATDLLVVGKSFADFRDQSTQVYNWTADTR